MPYSTFHGNDIYYEVSGTGSNLLFLNGSGATIAETAPLVAAVADQFEVAVMDPRGLGRSAMPPTAYAMKDLAADAADLCDHLGWERFRLAGMSFGGMVAQELAVTIPDRVERLALLCTSPGGAGGSSYPLHNLTDMEPEELEVLYPTLIDTRFTPDWLSSHDADRALVDLLLERLGRVVPDDVRAGTAMQFQARSDHDAYERLPRVRCPSFVAAGRFDGIAPPENSAAIAGQILGAELRLFDGGHLFLLQDPTALPAILSFLIGPDTPSAPAPRN